MRRAPSSKGKNADALRFSVFDAAHQIGLSDPNALRWLEQNSNISEEDEEEEQPETRPPSDAHPPSLVFSSSSSEPDSSIASPSNDHSTNYRGPYARNQAYPNAQFYPKQSQPNFHSPAQIYPDSRSPLGPNLLNASNPLSRLQIPAQKSSDPWPPTPLAIASLSPISQPTSRAPTPADKGSIKQIPEPKKSKKLTKAPRGGDSESESVPSRKGSASGASGNPNVIGSAGAPPTLPFLPFPSAISGETLRSDASVSGLSASSSGTVTQSIYPPSRASNEPRSVFEDDDRPSGHTQNSPSTSTANSNEAPSNHVKDKEGMLLRQKTKANSADAPPVPNVPSLPPGAGLSGQYASATSPQTREKEREERLSRNTRSGSESGNVSSVYTTQSHSDVGHVVQSDLGHTPSNPPLKPEPIHAPHSDLGHPSPVVARRRSVDESDVAVGEATLGVKNGHARTRSKSGDFTGIGWEQGGRTIVPGANGNVVKPIPMAKPPPTRKPPKPVPARSTATTSSPASPTPPNKALSSTLTFDHEEPGVRRENDNIRALEVQHQLQSFVALENTFEGSGRGSQDSRKPFARIINDTDTVRSSGEYDPFRAQPTKQRPTPSEALPHQFRVPTHEIPKEIPQVINSATPAPTKRNIQAPPTSFRTPENELPTGLVRASSISARPSVTINQATPISIIALEGLAEQNGAAGNYTRTDSKESELELGYSGFGLARDDGDEPAPFIVPSPSWAPLDLKRGRSGSVSAIPDSNAPTHPGQFLDVRADRQRASGLSIPRSVTPDSPRPVLVPPRSTLSPPPNVPTTPLAPSRSVTPVAPVRPTASPAPRAIPPQPTRALSPQARAASPALSRPQQRDTPSPPLPRNKLPTRTSSGVSQRVPTLPSGPRSTVAPPSRLGAVPASRPSTASTVQSVASTSSSLGLPPRSMSATPTPRNEILPHEQSSRFLDPESPLRSRAGSRDQLKEVEQPVQTQREKYPGGAEKYSGEGLAPRVRFIGVRSSNGSSQAGWQGRMEDMRHAGSPAQSDRWQEEETRPVSWQEFEEPSYLSYDEEENTQGYYEGLRYSAYEDEPASGDATNAMPVTPMDPQPGQEVTSTLASSTRGQPSWVLNDSSPASRESTFTLASVYDDEDEDVTPIPKTEKLAAAVRGMGQNGWASGRI
ncbi:hypothetical protein B0J17DRAFT_674768 [Rhizoctonia solani]|nr:hypothetical protein B0J17DRAFT_674768 [Rhizoctonia solani]